MKNIIYGLGFLISGCVSNGFNHEITTDKNPDRAQSIQGIKVVTFQLTETSIRDATKENSINHT